MCDEHEGNCIEPLKYECTKKFKDWIIEGEFHYTVNQSECIIFKDLLTCWISVKIREWNQMHIVFYLNIKSLVDDHVQKNLELKYDIVVKPAVLTYVGECSIIKGSFLFDWREHEPYAFVKLPLTNISDSFTHTYFITNGQSLSGAIVKAKFKLIYTKPLNDSMLSTPWFHYLSDEHRRIKKLDHDFTYRIGEYCYAVHKEILASVSSVWKSMFTTNMRERRRNSSTITNFDYTTFEYMLKFIYNGRLDMELNINTYFKLYQIADYYDIKKFIEYLVLRIYNILRRNLNKDNVLNIYEIALYYNIEELIDDCWFLIKHWFLDLHRDSEPAEIPLIKSIIEKRTIDKPFWDKIKLFDSSSSVNSDAKQKE